MFVSNFVNNILTSYNVLSNILKYFQVRKINPTLLKKKLTCKGAFCINAVVSTTRVSTFLSVNTIFLQVIVYLTTFLQSQTPHAELVLTVAGSQYDEVSFVLNCAVIS